MIAHNNNGYDQLLLEYSLKRKAKKIPTNVYFSDSLIMMRQIYPNGGCYKLGAIYKAFLEIMIMLIFIVVLMILRL